MIARLRDAIWISYIIRLYGVVLPNIQYFQLKTARCENLSWPPLAACRIISPFTKAIWNAWNGLVLLELLLFYDDYSMSRARCAVDGAAETVFVF